MKKKETESFHPVTPEDHKKLDPGRHPDVNESLAFPIGDAFDKVITEILDSDAEAEGETVVIALVDLDYFKRVNDEYGFAEGDRILIESGRYIASKAGKYASVFRIGGDEFGIIFRGTREREDIFLQLEEMRRDYDVLLPDKSPMTMTIGMATAFEDANRCAELIRKADGALYRAKTAGRNKVAMAKEEKMVPKTTHYTQDQLKRLAGLSKREDIGEAILLREALDMLLKKYDI
ncbi:diguanylate cyclase [Butyrivibrio sp. MC2013]|uniref:diguanylate cyclase n=1 Tax=Butyrivibrio sp. MC2013 TaxID=1280686 RepID=UPI0004187919|nr:diguanylate cyclase [Butyrivibrio sp. MC2013]